MQVLALIAGHPVPDGLYQRALGKFSEAGLASLRMAGRAGAGFRWLKLKRSRAWRSRLLRRHRPARVR